MQDMTDRSYVCDVEPEEPDEYVLSLTTQMSRLDDEVSSYVPPLRRSYAFGGVCGIAARCAIANLGRMKAINHLGVRQVRSVRLCSGFGILGDQLGAWHVALRRVLARMVAHLV